MNKEEFGKKLKEQRILKGESPADLGAILDVGVKQISRYESGELAPPHESLELLCTHYNYDFISLLFDLKGVEHDHKTEVPGLVAVGKSIPVNDILDKLLKEKDIVAQKIEEKAKLAEEYAAEMKQHYEHSNADKDKLFFALNKLQDSFDNTLKEISVNIKTAAANLKSNHDVLIAIGRTVRANDAEMLEALDNLEGNPRGTRQKRSHTVQKALREGAEAGDKNSGKDKIRKDVKKG